MVSFLDDNNKLNVCKFSEVIRQQMVPMGIADRYDENLNAGLDPVEPKNP